MLHSESLALALALHLPFLDAWGFSFLFHFVTGNNGTITELHGRNVPFYKILVSSSA